MRLDASMMRGALQQEVVVVLQLENPPGGTQKAADPNPLTAEAQRAQRTKCLETVHLRGPRGTKAGDRLYLPPVPHLTRDT